MQNVLTKLMIYVIINFDWTFELMPVWHNHPIYSQYMDYYLVDCAAYYIVWVLMKSGEEYFGKSNF